MPLYDLSCREHGVQEQYRPITAEGPLRCPVCNAEAEQVFGLRNAAHVRVSAMEDIGKDRTDERVRGVNQGLPGVMIPLGKDSTGKERFDYRPRYANEVNTVAKARQIAKEAGLSMADAGYYRSSR